MWQKIDMYNPIEFGIPKYDLEIMCRHAVDRSQGGLGRVLFLVPELAIATKTK